MNVSLVTGASSGLGRDIARLLCEKGHIVYAVARRKEKLQELKEECKQHKGEIRIVDGDLTVKTFREKLISQILKEEKKIDYLINNAGYGTLIHFEKQEFDDIEKMFNLNIITHEHLALLALPHMKEKKKGRIINISSIVAFEPSPYLATYDATKSAVYGFSRALSYELKNTGVSVSVVFPARMRTNFWAVAIQCYGLSKEERQICIDKIAKTASGSLPVAKYIVRRLDSKRLIFLPGILPKITYYLLRFIPIGWIFMKYAMEISYRKMISKHKVQKSYCKKC